jgi:hypothetical protein
MTTAVLSHARVRPVRRGAEKIGDKASERPSELRRPHIFAMPGQEQRLVARSHAAQKTSQPTGLDYPTTFAGSTQHFCVYYDATMLGNNGLTIANAVLASCEGDYDTISGFFGGLNPTPTSTQMPENPSGTLFNIIIAALDPSGQGQGGAYHYGCGAGDLYIDAKTNPSVDTYYSSFLVVAEEVEVFSANQAGAPWNCGYSNGEGLSRVLATELYPWELNGYTSAAAWLDNGRPDFVNNTDPTDTNYISIGCSVLFLNYLRYQEDFTWAEIIAAGGATLEATYQSLTGQSDGWTPFSNLLAQYFPVGQPSGLTTDNPFPLGVALSYPFVGVQFRGTVAANSTATWYTWGWPVLWDVDWNVVPTSVDGSEQQLTWSVAVQKPGPDSLTYWISITNLTGQNVDVEARYCVCGAV